MSTTRPPSTVQAVLTTLASVVAALGTARACCWLVGLVPAAATDRSSGPAGPLLAVAACLAGLVCARLALAAFACAGYGLASLAGRARWRPMSTACARAALALSPSLLRPVVSVLVAGGITVGSAGLASAATPVAAPLWAPPVPVATSTVATSTPATSTLATSTVAPDAGADRPQLPDPGWATTWTPARPTAPARSQPDVSIVAAPSRRGDQPAPVVVRRGDTLWAIAARHLGPGATDADIAEQWPRWWQANRSRIGDDPDRLLPGQVLLAPVGSSIR